jgi:aldehyde dehydrogenase (NAD+)
MCGVTAVTAAAEAAAAAQKSWANLPGPNRAEFLYKWAEQIQARSAEMGIAVAQEVGKPIGEAKGEVGRCIAILRYYAGEAVRETGHVIPALASGALQYSLQVPLGVVGLITPWNFPVAIPLWKAAPSLACGNTVVLKPAETAPLCAILLAETAKAAGLPNGVFNVLLGDGPEIGSALLECDLIRAVSFTGSSRVGAIVAEKCAARNIKFQTEMGGKNAGIVLADADLKQAAGLVAGGAMRFAGQKCTATSRVIVHHSVLDAFQAELIAAVQALKVTDPMEVDCAVGPVITEVSQKRIQGAITGLSGVVYSGEVPADGYYIAPTVVRDVDSKSDLAQVELFGPVLAILTAKDFDHAIEIANDVPYGLSAALYTKNIPLALQYANRIEAGLVRVNGDTTGVDPHAPFGGVKASSSGTREQGPAAKEFYTETKTVQINP